MKSKTSQSAGRRRDNAPARRFSRRWFLHGLSTFAWSAVITVLIWVYADIHFTAEEEISATLRINTGSAENIVLLTPSDTPIKFRVKGKRNFIDRFADRLSTQKSVLTYNPVRELGPGKHTERVSEILSNLPELKATGAQCSPCQAKRHRHQS